VASADGPTGAPTGGAADQPRRYIVGIGVGDYDLPQLRLPKVAGDVAKITAWFGDHPRLAHQRALPELLDSPTAKTIQESLYAWLEEREPDDVIVIYIAGHAEYEIGQAFLLGRDSPMQRLAGKALQAQTLGLMLGQFKPHNVLLIIDACVAGKMASQIQRAAEDAADEANTREPQRLWAQALVCSTFGRDPAIDGRFAQAFIDVVSSKKWTGTTQPWIDIDQLMRGLNEELRSIGSPQVAERKVWGPSPAELIPNPNFLPDVQADVMPAGGPMAAGAEPTQAAAPDPAPRRTTTLEAGRSFIGRALELRRIAGWLRGGGPRAPDSAGSLLVLTGSPGSGKSSLLRRVLTLSDAGKRAALPDLDSLPADSLPPIGAFIGRVDCHNKGLRELAVEVGQTLQRTVDGAASLLAAAHGMAFTLAVDGLDEALPGQAAAIIEQLLLPLAALPGVQLLVATRRQPVRIDISPPGQPNKLPSKRDLLEQLGADAEHTIQLDNSDNRQQDMRDLVLASLRDGSGGAAAQYRADAALANAAANQVVQAAGTSFLVARITATTLGADVAAIDPQGGSLSLPREVGAAMERYIQRAAEAMPGDTQALATLVRDMLRPLAWAQGAGLAWGSLWPRLASVLAGLVNPQQPPRDYSDADVQQALAAASDLIVESVEASEPVYRLFHEALAEHLRRDGAPLLTPASVHGSIADTLLQQAGGRPWTDVQPYIVGHLPQHLALAGDRMDRLLELVCDPLWERAKRLLTRDTAAWLKDLDLTLQALQATAPGDLRQVPVCLVYSRKLAAAPLPVLEVLARAGQLQRARRMAANLSIASERVQAYAMLAASHAQVADGESARRCLDQATQALAPITDTHMPMAWYWVARAAASCHDMSRSRAAASQAAAAAARLGATLAADGRGDTWDLPNAQFWAAMALRCAGDAEGLQALRESLAGNPGPALRNQVLQLASVLGDVDFLREALRQVLADVNAGRHSSIRIGNLALALADAKLLPELQSLMLLVPPGAVTLAGEKDAQKRLVWALALAGQGELALQHLANIGDTDERLRAAARVAEVAEAHKQTAVLEALATSLLQEAAPGGAEQDAIAAKALALAGHLPEALASVETLLRRTPASSSAPAPAPSPAATPTKHHALPRRGKSSRRPLAPDIARAPGADLVEQVRALVAAGQHAQALELALGHSRLDASGLPIRSAEGTSEPVLPASRALALNAVLQSAPADTTGSSQRLALWLEALRCARLAGHAVVDAVLASGPQIVDAARGAGRWAAVESGLAALERRWELEAFAEQYDSLRSAFGSGRQRTLRMTSLMLVPRRLATSLGWQADEVRAAGATGAPAKRVFVLGLMQSNQNLLDADLVVDCVAHSNSAFEQFLALVVADLALRRFTPAQAQRLRDAIAVELASDGSGRGFIGSDSSRRVIAERLAERLAGRPSDRPADSGA
jgi:hypothetical protein